MESVGKRHLRPYSNRHPSGPTGAIVESQPHLPKGDEHMADSVSSRTTAETMRGARTTHGRGPVGGRDTSEGWHRLFLRAHTLAQGAWGQLIVPFGSGFFLGRAVVFDSLHPFGTAYVVALAAVGHRGRALVAAGGVLLAAATSPLGTLTGEPTPILIFVWLLAAVVGRLFDLPAWVSALGAMLGAATLRIVAAAFGGEGVVAAGLAGVVDMSAALALLPVAARLFGRRARSRPGQHGLYQTQSRPLDSAYVASLLLFVSIVLLGTQGMQWYGYSLHALLTRIMLLLAAVSGGVGGGATAGTLLGLLASLGAGDIVWEGVLFAGAGLAAGLGAVYGRVGALMGLLIAHLLLSVYAPDGQHIGSTLMHSLLAGMVVAFVPRTLLRSCRTRLELIMTGGALRRHGQAAAATLYERLERFAQVFEQAGTVFAGDDAAAASNGVGLTGVNAGLGSWTGFEPEGDPDVTAASRPGASIGMHGGWSADGTAELDHFVQNVFETVCRGCSHQSVCWETYAYQTYRDLLTVAADAGPTSDGKHTRPFQPRHLPGGLRQRCIKPQHLVPGVDKLLLLMHDNVRRQEQMSSAHAPMQRQLTGIADIISGVARELSRMEGGSARSEALRSADKPRFQLQTDYVQVPGDDSDVSGDCFQRVDLTDGRVAFIVCDGMGSGTRAAVESKAVVAMLRRFMEAGFELHFCVQTINAVMLLRATEESFVTVDVCVVDLRDGTARMLKTGAAPTFIHRGDTVEMVRADSLPVGILPTVEVYEAQRQLNLGDVLIMMSDGGLDLGNPRGDKAEAVRRQMQRLDRPRPRQVVDSLFARAHQSSGQRLPDDVTIVAAQLLPAVIPSI